MKKKEEKGIKKVNKDKKGKREIKEIYKKFFCL
jgi:hypothetical protein